MRVYEEMASNDATIGAALYAIEAFLRRIDYEVKPAADTPEAKAEAVFLDQCMHDMDQSWDDFISDVLSMLVYGYSLHEIVYKYRRGLDQTNPRYRSRYNDGRLGWRSLALRAQRTIDRWEVDTDTGEILGAYQEAPPKYKTTFLPMRRCVLFRTKAYKNNPEGVSMLRRAYRAWKIKKKLEEVEATGVARDLNGLAVMELPEELMSATATPAQKSVRAQIQKLVSLIARDQVEGVVIPAEVGANGPTGYKFRLASSSGSKQILADGIIRRYDGRIAMSLAAEFLLLGMEKTGSFALAAEKSSHFVKSLEWYARAIVDQLNTVVVPRLMQVNGVPPELWPTIQHSPIQVPDLKELGTFLQQIGGAGLLTPTAELEAHIRSVAQFPDPTGEELEAMRARGVPPVEEPVTPEEGEPRDDEG